MAHVSVQHMLITATNILNVVTTISTLLLYMDLVRMTYWTLKYLVHIHAAETQSVNTGNKIKDICFGTT